MEEQNSDHSLPQITVKYSPLGNIECIMFAPPTPSGEAANSRQATSISIHKNRIRLDSGYDDDPLSEAKSYLNQNVEAFSEDPESQYDDQKKSPCEKMKEEKGSAIQPRSLKWTSSIVCMSVIVTLRSGFFDFNYKCTEECERILSTQVSNGKLTCEEDILRLECSTGYKPEDVEIFNCSSPSAAMASLQCAPKMCLSPPTPKNGKTVCKESTEVGSTCQVKCFHGDKIGTVTCLNDLTWSPLPSCPAPPCSKLDNSTGLLACSVEGRHCFTHCKAGISKESSCNDEGIWEHKLSNCSQKCPYAVIPNGFLACENKEKTQMFQVHGVPTSTVCNIACEPRFEIFSGPNTMACGDLGKWNLEKGQYEKSVLVVAGGEFDGHVLNTVEVYGSQKSLPTLPEALKWGNFGFVGNKLLLCGGQNKLYQSSACWVLDSIASNWKLHSNLTRCASLNVTGK